MGYRANIMDQLVVVGAIAIPIVGGGLGAWFTAGYIRDPSGKAWFENLRRPSWAPPGWVFGPVWTALYVSMGYASYLVFKECGGVNEKSTLPLAIYGCQLLLNWSWQPLFFKFKNVGAAFAHIGILDVAAIACVASFYNTKKTTFYFMLPYLCWMSVATSLNYALWQLNEVKDKKE